VRHLLPRWVLTVYLLLVVAAFVVAAVRLSQSTEMPGLDAIELVLLALPWSLALGVEPVSRLGLGGMAAIVLGGLVLNGLILSWLAAWLQRHRGRARS
jgi:ABC-type Co2+ transport system permease subunit